MKNKLFALVLTLAPAALHAGTIPLPNTPKSEASWQVSSSTDRGQDFKGCLRFVGKELEHGVSATTHFTRETERTMREGLTMGVKKADHAVVKTGEWIVGS